MPDRSSIGGSDNVDDDKRRSSTAEETAPAEKNPAAVALGRLGGMKGGRARAQRLSARRRSEIARKAARARWDNVDPA